MGESTRCGEAMRGRRQGDRLLAKKHGPVPGYNRDLAFSLRSLEGRGVRRKRLTGHDIRSMLIAVGIAFLLVIVALAGGCGGEEQSSGSSEDESTEQAAAKQETTANADSTTASIGEPVTVGNVQWTVTDAKQQSQLITDSGRTEDGNFVITDVTFQNNSNQDITLATPFMILRDDEGNEFEPDIDTNFTFLYPEENMFVGHVEPGTTKEGKAIFTVDQDSSGFELQVGEGRFASNKLAYIDLGI